MMDVEVQKLYSVEEIAYFLNLQMNNEDFLRCFDDSKSAQELQFYLEMKQNLFRKEGNSHQIRFNIDVITDKISKGDINVLCQCIKIANVVVKCSRKFSEDFFDYLLERFEDTNATEDNVLDNLKLLSSCLDCANLQARIKILLFEGVIFRLITGQSIKIRQFVIIYIIRKYMFFSGGERLLNKIWLHAFENKDLSLLCVCSQFYLNFNCEYDLTIKTEFWSLVQHKLTNINTQKEALFLLKMAIDKLTQSNKVYKLDLIQWDPEYKDSLNQQWKTFFAVIELCKEKQLHLLKPAFNLIKSLTFLHSSWKSIVYLQLLSHPQEVIITQCVSHILSTDIVFCQYNILIQSLLEALNNNFLYSAKNSKTIPEKLTQFLKRLNANQVDLFIQTFSGITWTPIPLFYFLKCLQKSGIAETYPVRAILPILIHLLNNLPHFSIRIAGYKLLLEIFYTNCKQSSYFGNHLYVILQKIQKSQTIVSSVIDLQFEFNDELLIDVKKNLEHFKQAELCTTEAAECFMIYLSSVQNINGRKKYIAQNVWEQFLQKSFLEPLKHGEFPLTVTYAMLPYLVEIIAKEENLNYDSILAYIENHMCFAENEAQVNVLSKVLRKINETKTISLDQLLTRENLQDANPLIFVYLITMENVHLFKNVTKSDEFRLKLYHSQGISFKEAKITDIIRNALETQNVAKVINACLKCLKSLLQTKTYDIEFEDILPVCYDSMQEIKNTPNYLKSIDLFTDIIFDRNLTGGNRGLLTCFYFSSKLMDLAENVPSIAAIIARKMRGMLEECEIHHFIVIESLLVKLLLFGSVLRKDQRIEFQAISTEPSLQNLPSIYEDIAQTRKIAVEMILYLEDRMLKDPSQRNIITSTFQKLYDLLLAEYQEHYKKRYFENSQAHLITLRIMQGIFMTHEHLSEDQKSKCVQFLTDCLQEKTHQLSVRHIARWTLLKLILKMSKDDCLQILRKQVEDQESAQSTSVTEFVPIIYHLAVEKHCNGSDEELIQYLLDLLGPLTMGPLFSVRLHAQYAYTKLIELIAGDSRTKNPLYLYAMHALNCTKINDSNKHIPFLYENGSLKTSDNFRTLYSVIPQKYNVDEFEWCYYEPHYFEKKVRNWTAIVAEDNNNDQTQKNQKENEEQCWQETGILQRKIAPWMDDMFREITRSTKTTNDVIVVASLIDRAPNLGGLSRTCEIFGVKQYVVNSLQHVKDKEFQSLSMSSENWIDIAEVKQNKLVDFLVACKENGYSIVGTEQTSDSVLLTEYKFPKKTVIVLGHEKEGIPPNLLYLMDTCVEIPQFGVVRSLNVHVAGALMIWEYTRQNYQK